MTTAAVVCALAENLSSKLAEKLMQEASLVTGFEKDFEFICNELDSIQCLVKDTGEKRNSRTMSNFLDKLECFLYDAVEVVNECGLPAKFCDPIFHYMMGRKIRELKETIKEIHGSAKYLKYLKSIQDVNAYIASEDKRERASSLVQEMNKVGMEKEITKVTELILEEDGKQVIGVVGMGGMGKTLLAQHVFRSESVEQHFAHRVWLTISQKFVVDELLVEMGRQIKLDATELHGNEVRTKIHEKIKESRCLFVLDDVWDTNISKTICLLGLKNSCKILVTTRDTRVVDGMGNGIVRSMHELSEEDCKKLFCIHAFPDREWSPPKELEHLVINIVNKCGKLPLALKTIGAYMRRVRRYPNDWESTLNRLNETEPMTDQVRPSLSLSYHALPHNLKLCFLYCSLFPKSTEIRSEYIVSAWIGEGFTPETAQDAYDVGCSYVDELVDRCLIEVSQVHGNGRVKYFKLHDLLYDFALSEINNQTKCLIEMGMELKEFPVGDWSRHRRISLIKNKISAINDKINFPRIRTLLLWNNINLAQISSIFFSKLKYLAVLDLSQTSINVLPETVGNLKHLKLLNLSRTKIEKLPESLASLPSLQYLDVSRCEDLSELHSGIGNQQSILHLNLKCCEKLEWLPAGISKVIYLQKLKGVVFKLEENAASPKGLQLSCLFKRKNVEALQLRDLKGFILLQSLSLTLHAPSSEGNAIRLKGIFAGMANMRDLSLEYIKRSSTDDPLRLPEDIAVMKRLENIHLSGCLLQEWVFQLTNLVELKLDGDNSSTDNYTGLLKIPNLRRLTLLNNTKCTDIPKEFGESGAFPELERFIIQNFTCLQNFPPWHDESMPKLKKNSRIEKCDQLKNIPPKLKKYYCNGGT